MQSITARLEGGLESVHLQAFGHTIFFRHPTQETLGAAMAQAGVDPEKADAVAKNDTVGLDELELGAKMSYAYELLGAYCVERVDPPLEGVEKLRERGPYQQRLLTEAAMEALDPYLTRLGEYLFEQATASDAEGEG